jgi:hypothetical protein
VLQKTLTEYLDKGFIQVSNSPVAALVLFVQKLGGGLWFCIDYYGLNQLTQKDCYLLLLIYKTLQSIRCAQWFTKLDIVTVFYKVQIQEGQE